MARRIAKTLIACVAALVFAGCSSASGPVTTGSHSAPPSASPELHSVTLTLVDSGRTVNVRVGTPINVVLHMSVVGVVSRNDNKVVSSLGVTSDAGGNSVTHLLAAGPGTVTVANVGSCVPNFQPGVPSPGAGCDVVSFVIVVS